MRAHCRARTQTRTPATSDGEVGGEPRTGRCDGGVFGKDAMESTTSTVLTDRPVGADICHSARARSQRK
eukprot:80606-Pyramimonas_sp.AAC.1